MERKSNQTKDRIILNVSDLRPKDFPIDLKERGDKIDLPKNYFVRVTRNNTVHIRNNNGKPATSKHASASQPD